MKRKIRNIMVILIFTGWAVCAGNREVIPLEKNGTEEVLSHEWLKNNLAEKYSFSSLTITEGRYREYRDNPPMIDIDICYPQLHGMQDSRKEERINALIAEDALRLLRNNPVYTRFQEGSYPYEKNTFCLNQYSGKIPYVSRKLLCIRYGLFTGVLTPGKGLSSVSTATVIDLEQEKILMLPDVVDDFALLSDWLMEDRFVCITKWDNVACGQQVSELCRNGYRETLYQNLQAEEFGDMNQWYVDGERFVLIYNDGYYYEFAMDIEEAGDFLKADFRDSISDGTQWRLSEADCSWM